MKQFHQTAEALQLSESILRGIRKAMHVYMATGKVSTSRKNWAVTIRENPSARAALVNVPVLWEVKEFTSSVAYAFLWVKDNTDEVDARLFVVYNGRDLKKLDSSMVVSPNDKRVEWFKNVIHSDDLRKVSTAENEDQKINKWRVLLTYLVEGISSKKKTDCFRDHFAIDNVQYFLSRMNA